jgi:hypothetical protein
MDARRSTGMMPFPPGESPRGERPPSRHERFRAHGRTLLWADGALVHVLAEGPFNREAADQFSDAMVALYRQLPAGQRFVNLTEFRTSMMATPEAWELLATHLARVDASGLPLVATAWIAAADVEGQRLFLPRAAALFASRGRVFETFTDATAAESWARRLLAT